MNIKKIGKLTCETDLSSDGWSGNRYEYKPDEPVTVAEFIQTILDEYKDCWGYIKIDSNYCKFEKGVILHSNINDADRLLVKRASGHESWSRLDVTLELDSPLQ